MPINFRRSRASTDPAYVLSQKHEGWTALPHRYDDGGFSGGAMDRPALHRLLEDVPAGRVDAVLVYKVDRLTFSGRPLRVPGSLDGVTARM